MTKKAWLAQFDRDKDKLELFIANYHPASGGFGQSLESHPITAKNAEAACAKVRKAIKNETIIPPQAQFKEAVAKQDVEKLSELLNQAWFGVPESTSCWGITGFREAVALLEDPVEYDDPA